MQRWLVPFLALLLIVGCAPALVQSVGSNLAQSRAPLPEGVSRDVVAAPVTGDPAPETVPAASSEQVVPDGQEHAAAVASDEALRVVAASNNTFALDLLGILRAGNPNANVLFSPVSIYSAFAMLYAGADGDTALQMAEVLHFDPDGGALHTALGALEAALTPSGTGGFTLTIANALWGQEGTDFAAPYLDTLARYYGASLQSLDFAGNPAGAAETVNRWVHDATNGKIPAIVQGFDPGTALVLANAIYFNADWAILFDKEATEQKSFTPLAGGSQEVEMMRVSAAFAYAEGENYQMVAIPYAGGTARMIVILPHEGAFSDFEAGLTVAQLETMLDSLNRQPRDVVLSLPRFDYETTTDLREVLGALGLTLPFGSQADFSGINGRGGLAVDQAIHRARITVDEEGTEAAAATVISVVTLSAGADSAPVTMTADRPFIYLIEDTQTGTLLFVGRIVTLN